MSDSDQILEPTGAATPAPSSAIAAVPQRPQRTLLGDAWRRFRRHRMAMIGAATLLFLTLAVLVGPSLYVPYQVGLAAESGLPLPERDQTLRGVMTRLDFLSVLSPPSQAHPFGTDELGRDLFARALFGGRFSLSVGLAAMLISIGVGTLIGALSGFFGGVLDQILMRITDLFLSLPVLPLLLVTIYLFRDQVARTLGTETGIFLIVVTMIGLLAWMPTARIVRASFLSLKEKEFVEAAICLGVSRRSIMFRHILPNAIGPIIVAATLDVGAAIITESTLSFLGVGFPPDTPTWGRLVTDGNSFLQAAPHLALIPATLIFLTVLSINYIGDGLRDALDPRSRL